MQYPPLSFNIIFDTKVKKHDERAIIIDENSRKIGKCV